MALKTKRMSTDPLPKPFYSGPWHFADPSNLKSNGGRDLPDQVFSRLAYDESLTVPELDKILFNPPSSDYLWTEDSIAAEDQLETEYGSGWTWDRLVSLLKAQGKVPEEVARREGLLES